MKKILFIILLLMFTVPLFADNDIMRPTANRYGVSNWTVYPSGDAWDAINDLEYVDGDLDYVFTVDTGANYIGWIHSDWSGISPIDSVRLVYKAKRIGTLGTARIAIGRMDSVGGSWGWCADYDDGYDTVTLTVGSGFLSYAITWTNDPCSGNPWTASDLNSISKCWAVKNISCATAVVDSFGLNAGNNTGVEAANMAHFERFQMGACNSILTHIRIEFDDATPTDSVQVVIYSDTLYAYNYPRHKLYGDNVGIPVTDDWVTKVTEAANLINLQYYWLAYKLKSINAVRYQSGGVAKSHRWRSQTWSTPWPASYSNLDFTEANSNANQSVLKGIYRSLENRVTQAYINVYSKQYRWQIAEPDRGIIEGGISK